MCRRKGSECPIGDIAPLVYINKRVEKYQQYKVLADANTPEILLLEILDQAGLRTDVDTLLQAEVIYAEARRKHLDKVSRNSKKRK